MLVERRSLRGALAVASVVVALGATADWQLESADSSIGFTTVKADHIAENHRFEAFSGRVTDAGAIHLVVPLDSTNTGIAIRDERIREMLFDNTAIEAVVTSHIDPASVPSAGATVALSLPLNLEVVGVDLDFTAAVLVTRVNDDHVVVSSRGPVLLNVGQLGWASGVDRLREVAGLPSISHAVPVSFVLSFERGR